MVHAGALPRGLRRAAPAPDHPPLRVIWCAQAYREFEGLYDVALIAVTEDHGSEALVSRLSLQAVGYDDAMALGKRFLEAVQLTQMIWVEILSRHRDVAARFRIADQEVRIGRGYDNDVIVDDPYVAARHLRVFRDEAGQLVAEDLGSANGTFLYPDKRRQPRIVIDGDRPIRIGHTDLRIRDDRPCGRARTRARPDRGCCRSRPRCWAWRSWASMRSTYGSPRPPSPGLRAI